MICTIDQFLRNRISCTLTASALILCCGCKEENASTEPPNVLVIVWDSVGAKHMSLYGYHQPTTPKLTQWAAKGRVFENCLTPAAAGTTAYASILTGLLPSEHANSYREKVLDGELTTLAEWMRDHGYQTYLYSAHPLIAHNQNFGQGFETVEHPWDSSRYGEALELVRSKVPLGDLSSEISRKIHAMSVSRWALTAAGEFANRSLNNWLANRSTSKPFFALINYTEAHQPLLPTMEHRARVMTSEQLQQSKTVERLRLNVWKYSFGAPIFNEQDLEVLAAMYDATICELDDLFDELMSELERGGQLENTVVILVSDHGELQGEHQILGNDYALYQPLLHVPLIVWGDKRLPTGTDPHPVMNIDLMPTILELAGIGYDPSSMPHAISLLSPRSQRVRFAEYPAHHLDAIKFVRDEHPAFDPGPWEQSLRCVVEGDLKLIRGSSGKLELYDLKSDPNETRNLVDEKPEDVKRLQALLDSTFGDASKDSDQ